ncbi:hypothetical protein CLV59_10550 [Chitinophaga dinghuensis]|uniref:Uncharacterized protein n=1 Tax=Chitinophaga dinghuensis TaxID=1539050 RepID=A0A327VYC2_9BACT|nr:hypothetical protein CLV59_10550 [Chitinophaga dinghuensis]
MLAYGITHTLTHIRKHMNSKGDGKNCWRIGINYSKPKLALTKDKVNYWLGCITGVPEYIGNHICTLLFFSRYIRYRPLIYFGCFKSVSFLRKSYFFVRERIVYSVECSPLQNTFIPLLRVLNAPIWRIDARA